MLGLTHITRKLFGTPTRSLYTLGPQFIRPLTADQLLTSGDVSAKRTKSVCTIGPQTQHPDNALKLINEGLSVARLNFSHGDHAEHLGQMVGVNTALKAAKHAHTSILLDTKGPEIRTGFNLDDKPIMLKKGQLLELTTDYSHKGTSQRIACSYGDLARSSAIGNLILFADGGISAVVKKIESGIVAVEILNDGKLGNKKNMCLPGAKITLPTITDLDEYDIADFGLKHKVDYIAVSFARYASDLHKLRQFMIKRDPEHGRRIHLVSKIQNHEGIHNLEEIIQASDGIMVARGDLGMEVPLEKIVLLQKYITKKTIDAGKYVICATQMVESMETKPRPTRAEISDLTNSVLDLTDANMTSGETTNGQFPIEAARYLNNVAKQTEQFCDYARHFYARLPHLKAHPAIPVATLSFTADCSLIFAHTDSLDFIQRLSSFRPKAFIICFTDSPSVKKLSACMFGVYCYPKQMGEGSVQEFVKGAGQRFVGTHQSQVNVARVWVDSQGQTIKVRGSEVITCSTK